MHLNECGKIVRDEWFASFEIRNKLAGDEFVIMANHFHGIVQIVETHCCASLPATNTGIAIRKPKSISSFMAGVKSAMAKRINIARGTPGAPVMQPRFHDHVIRDEMELIRIRHYIKNNPTNWHNDTFNTIDNNCVREPEMVYGREIWMI
jgi:REP element-mobilizing transposase RayT